MNLSGDNKHHVLSMPLFTWEVSEASYFPLAAKGRMHPESWEEIALVLELVPWPCRDEEKAGLKERGLRQARVLGLHAG